MLLLLSVCNIPKINKKMDTMIHRIYKHKTEEQNQHRRINEVEARLVVCGFNSAGATNTCSIEKK